MRVTQDEARQYLRQVRVAQRRVELARAETRRIMSDYGVGGMDYDAPRVQTSPTGDALERLAIERDQAVAKLTWVIIDAVRIEMEAVDLMTRLEDPEEALALMTRYVYGAKLEDMSDALAKAGIYVGERQACRLLSRAVASFARLMERHGIRAAA